MIEIDHELLQIPLTHLPVADAHVRLGNQRLNVRGDLFDRLDLVVNEVDLTAAPQLTQRGLAQGRVVPFDHKRLDRKPLGGRGRDQ